MIIKVISNLIELQTFKEEIKSKIDQNNFYQSYDFIEVMMKIFPKKKFKIIFSKNKNNYIFLPLHSFRYFLKEFFGFVGSPHFNEENCLSHNYKDNEQLANDLTYILSNIKITEMPLYFNNLDHKTYVLFKNIKLIEVSRFETNSICLKKSTIWKSRDLKNKIIKDLNFKLRKFFNQNNFDHNDIKLVSDKVNLKDLNNFILKNKNINLKNKKILSENLKIFFSLYKNDSRLEISQLTLNKTLLSVVLGVNIENKYYYFIPCFNNSYYKYSFGNNHLCRLIQIKKENGYDKFILGPGGENYKKNFNISSEKIYSFTNKKYLAFILKLKKILKT